MDESSVLRDQILRRICGEYLEMPGLRLTRAQAQRLWGLDEQTCLQFLELLTDQGFLHRRVDGTYTRLPDEATTAPHATRMAKADLKVPTIQTPGHVRSRS